MKPLPSISSQIDEKIINKVIQKKFALLSSYFFYFMSNWLIRAYKRYNDIDKFLIIIYLIHKNLIFYRKNALVIDYESFYKERTLEIEKINISDISHDLKIPKESVRRKVLDLEKKGSIKKIGKKIFVDKSTFVNLQAIEIDQLASYGYKTNKTGFELGTNFEYLEDFRLGLSTSTFLEKIETDSTASTRQKAQKGNYLDTFLKFNFDLDKRNQKFKTSEGYRSRYNINVPIVSDTNTLTNSYNYKIYSELYENNLSSFSLLLKSATSITSDDVKLSERLSIPSNRLRGFERGKVGPRDGADYIGGNYLTTINFQTTIPGLFDNSQNLDGVIFFDAANVWGVDYDSSIDDGNEIRSSIGIGIDWLTVVGPLNFSLTEVISKSESDIAESFRFNLGTTF